MARTFYALPFMLRQWVELTRLESEERRDHGKQTYRFKQLADWADFWEVQIKRLTGVAVWRAFSFPDENDARIVGRFIMQRANSMNEQRMYPERRAVIEGIPSDDEQPMKRRRVQR
jgi:hypothetical protein